MMMPRLHELFLQSHGVCTDTRKVSDGDLFFALKGPNFNGNLFAGRALEAGASYVIVDEEAGTPDDRTILVEDVLTSLQDLARYHRMQFDIPVLGITGSNGKTTNKELIYSVLSRKYNTLCTRGNLNNHIGVPLTLLELTNAHEMAIVEMGANHIGEIHDLSNMAHPGYGLITSIGAAHLEGFGSLDGVRQTKRELFDHVVKNGGKCFINLGVEQVPSLFEGDDDQAVFFGSIEHPPYLISHEQLPHLKANFKADGHELLIRSQLIGSFQANNLLHAIAIGLHFKVAEKDIVDALEQYQPDNNRAQLLEFKDNTVILDAYNANPPSMKAAIEAFLQTTGEPKMVILGDMFELGPDSLKYHQEIADMVDNESIEAIVLVGKDFSRTNRPLRFYHFDTTTEAQEWWSDQDVHGYNILIKGSRGVHLEVLLED